SGASLVYQATSALSGGLSPFVATLLSNQYGWPAVAAYMVGCCAITASATWFAPETHRGALDAPRGPTSPGRCSASPPRAGRSGWPDRQARESIGAKSLTL